MKKIILVSLLLLSCAAQRNHTAPATSAADEHSNLTREQAEARAKLVHDVRYELTLSLNETSRYEGTQVLTFGLTKVEDVRVDFFRGEVKALEINGRAAPVTREPTFLTLKKEFLRYGDNVVKVTFATEMQTNGTGLHRFQDPQDKAVYLYTQFEAFYAHKFMPCFDQPDLKAKLRMTVSAPAAWTVISTTRESAVTATGQTRTWTFPETPPLSTYLFSLHAGPFKIWEDSFQGVPLRLMARPSLAKFVDHQFWFKITKQGLGFYNKYFAFPYPFKKYDQVIVPEFNAGAMENVGAVTFAERYLKRGRMSEEDEMSIASVLLHEMAHMWFGDLVTMRWWNDLWLNESFATYMSALALAEATSFKGKSWTDFFASDKQWAYYQDQLVTSHPIEGIVPDTDSAFSSFDGITYGKGAAVLKQMNRWLTPDAFRQGVQHYFKTHAYKNTELSDFIGALQKFSKKDFVGWSKVWLQQAGVDTLSVSMDCENMRLRTVTLSSTSSLPAQFRPQALELGFYRVRGGKLSLTASKPIELEKHVQDYSFDMPCPDLVYPNHNDHGYLKVSLSKEAVPVLASTISTLPEVLGRLMLWANLWQMVRDHQLPVQDYAAIASSQLGNEKNEQVLKMVVDTISGNDYASLSSVVGYWPVTDEALGKARAEFITRMEEVYAKKLAAAPAGKDMQYFWWDAFVALSTSQQARERLSQALEGEGLPNGLVIDQDRRWTAINRLCRVGEKSCFALVEKEGLRDSSDRGVRAAFGARAAFPDDTNKEKLLKEALANTSLSLQNRKAITRNLFPYEQKASAVKLQPVFFDFFLKNKNSGDFETIESLSRSLSSLNCSDAQAKVLTDFMQAHPDLSSPMLRDFREKLDEDGRCRKIRALAVKK